MICPSPVRLWKSLSWRALSTIAQFIALQISSATAFTCPSAPNFSSVRSTVLGTAPRIQPRNHQKIISIRAPEYWLPMLRVGDVLVEGSCARTAQRVESDSVKAKSAKFAALIGMLFSVIMTPKRASALSALPAFIENAAQITRPMISFGAKFAEGVQQFAFPEMHEVFQEIQNVMPPLKAMPRLFGQLALALAAYRVSRIVAWGVRGYCVDNHIDVTTAVFLAELLRYGTLLLASIILFQAFGVQTPQSFTAIVTSLTLAVGLSFQSVLSNFAAGVMLLVFRPYSVGDKVRIGNRVGFVYDISLLATRVDTEDNVRIQVPNSQILNGVVENYTSNPLRRVEVLVTVSPRASVVRTKEVLQTCIASFAYLGTAGSTGPAKNSSYGHDSGSKVQAPWGGRALANVLRGNQWITPSELLKGLAAQYSQLWKVANGQYRLELADVAAKKAPGPEVVLREISPLGLRWQTRVWAPSRRYTAVLYQMTESIAAALEDAGIELAAASLLSSSLSAGYQLALEAQVAESSSSAGAGEVSPGH